MSKKTLMTEILPGPDRAERRASPRERAHAHMQRLIGAASLSLVACSGLGSGPGYGVVDPMPEPSSTPPEPAKPPAEEPRPDVGYAVVDPIPAPAICKNGESPSGAFRSSERRFRADGEEMAAAPPPARVTAYAREEQGKVRLVVAEGEYEGLEIDPKVRAEGASVSKVEGATVLLVPEADVMTVHLKLICGGTLAVKGKLRRGEYEFVILVPE